jgi:hypothetical protein
MLGKKADALIINQSTKLRLVRRHRYRRSRGGMTLLFKPAQTACDGRN